jgi:NADH dehydrogenase
MSHERARVLVVGAGFGGLSAAAELRKADVDVTVLDRNNYQGFWPLLYQVATGILETQEIAYPVRSLLRKQKNVDFRLAEVGEIDFAAREVVTDRERLSYDYLVLAGGSTTNYFGNDALAEHTFGLKDVDDADRLRNHILSAVEAAARVSDPDVRDALLTFVIVGGGATGVELAGQLSLLLRRTLPREFPSIDFDRARVLLVNAGPGVLESFPERLQRYALASLQQRGVELRLEESVTEVDAGRVRLGDGTELAAATVVWAAGVRACDLAGRLDVPVARGGRVAVTPELNVAAHDEVFVVGDMAYLEGHANGGAYPMVAQVAMQQGRCAARNIVAAQTGAARTAFRYFDKGQMAMIGRRSAVVEAFGLRLRGVPAWLGWLALHLLYLRGLRNRLIVVLDWFSAFLSPARGAGVITRPTTPELVARMHEDDERKAA